MTHTRGLRSLRNRRLWALIAGVALLLLVLSLSGVRSTMAGWTSSDETTGSFSAAKIGPVQNLTCSDKKNAPVLGLLARQVKLKWDSPGGVESDLVEYEVTWKQSGLLGGSGAITVNSPEHIYTAERLGLLTLTVNFTVRAKSKYGSWIGPTQTASAKSVSLLGLGLILSCN